MNPLFSVIIPVYNVEEYLKECIDSVLVQTYQNYEAILVDDGSKDLSGDICDKYVSENPGKIYVIHKENRGLLSARNTGLEVAKGDYIVLLDSDDFLISIALENFEINIKSTHADIYAGNILRMELNGMRHPVFGKRSSATLKVNSGVEFLNQNIKNGTWEAPAQFNIYKRSFLEKNQIKFKEGILHEDELWTPQVFLKAFMVEDVEEAFYVYRIRDGSITTSKSPKTKNAKDLINKYML